MDSDNLERTLDENLALLSSLCPPEPGTAVQPPVLRPPRRTAQLAAKLRRQLEENRPWLTAVESNLLSAARGRPVKTLYVTSCRPGEGKSMAAVLLAHTLAGSGGTVLVDANLTHPTLHSAFVARHAPGLVDYVAGDVELEDVAQHTDIARLALLPCGGDPATQPSGSLSPQALGQRLKELRNRFDWVVFSGNPCSTRRARPCSPVCSTASCWSWSASAPSGKSWRWRAISL